MEMQKQLLLDLENLKIAWTVTRPTHCAGCGKKLGAFEVPLFLFRDLKEKGRAVEVVGIGFHFECAEKRLSHGPESSGAE
jgi:hypothetical protein